MQLPGGKPKELTALSAGTNARQPKKNIALTKKATVCLFFQLGKTERLLALALTEEVKTEGKEIRLSRKGSKG